MEIKTYKSINVVINDGFDCFEYLVYEDEEGVLFVAHDGKSKSDRLPLGDKEAAKAVAQAILKICE